MKTNKTEKPVSSTATDTKEPLKLSLRSERLKNLGIRSGVRTGGTCTSITHEPTLWVH